MQNIGQKIDEMNCCIIIPTYNNDKTLKRVIDGVLDITDNIVVINDGSTDNTKTILDTYPQIHCVHFKKNCGKGKALREGFKKAKTLGYRYGITIDSDGQHYPDDIPVFLNEIEKEGEALLIGSRNMNQEGVPKKSSFGNKFSSFWFWVETGIKLNDTQSGFRLYPLEKINNISFYTSKFEFEIEVIVKAAWRGIKVKNVPIKVLYDEAERVSHFRPFKDFTRISILNTWLVIVTFLVIKPRDYFRKFKEKGFKRFFFEDLLSSNDTRLKKSLSVALGVFMGIAPFWGFQTILVLLLAVVLRLNKLIAFAFSNISIPPFIPFIVYLSLKMGGFLLTGSSKDFNWEDLKNAEGVANNIYEYIVGSFSLAIIMAVLFGGLSYVFLWILDKAKSKAHRVYE